MADSLADQLLKAGLATKQDAKRVEAEKRRQKRQKKPRNSKTTKSEAALAAERAKAEKRQRDQALNREREFERRQKANENAAREMVLKHEIPHGKDGEIAFHFTRDSKVKHIYVTAAQQKKLAAGELAIARTRGHYRLLPRDIAERVKSLAPFLIVFLHEGGEDDDPAYQEHPIPDDLVW